MGTCVCVPAYMCVYCMWRSEDNFPAWVLSFHYARDQTQPVRLGSRRLYPLSRLAGPTILSSNLSRVMWAGELYEFPKPLKRTPDSPDDLGHPTQSLQQQYLQSLPKPFSSFPQGVVSVAAQSLGLCLGRWVPERQAWLRFLAQCRTLDS